MKGVVFTEFLELVEQRHSLDMVDALLDDVKPASGGAYTSVGTYPHAEMAGLVTALAQRTGASAAGILREFGLYLFQRFVVAYPMFFEGIDDALDFLAGIEDVIHAEVLKLYPDAELPRLPVVEYTSSHLHLRYESTRHLEDLAEGLIEGCLVHFGTNAVLERIAPGEGEHHTQFVLRRYRP